MKLMRWTDDYSNWTAFCRYSYVAFACVHLCVRVCVCVGETRAHCAQVYNFMNLCASISVWPAMCTLFAIASATLIFAMNNTSLCVGVGVWLAQLKKASLILINDFFKFIQFELLWILYADFGSCEPWIIGHFSFENLITFLYFLHLIFTTSIGQIIFSWCWQLIKIWCWIEKRISVWVQNEPFVSIWVANHVHPHKNRANAIE